MNGDSILENGDAAIIEEVIEPKKITREKVHVNFADDAEYRIQEPSPPATPTELSSEKETPVVIVTDVERPADEEEAEEVQEEVIMRSEVKHEEAVAEVEDDGVDFVPGER